MYTREIRVPSTPNRVKVSFETDDRDWSKLLKSGLWEEVERFLEGEEPVRSRWLRQEDQEKPASALKSVPGADRFPPSIEIVLQIQAQGISYSQKICLPPADECE